MSAILLANVLDDFTEWLNDIGGEWWFLLVILAVAFFDSVIPIVPSETTVIVGGVAAGQGDQSLPLVILAGATGAFLGDNLAYLIGRRFTPWIERRAAARPKTALRLEWARRQIRSRGGPLLITARFVPGGRTALTLTSGITHQPRAWFAGWIALAAVIWASYAALLGYFFGNRFKDDHTAAFLFAFGCALGITLLLELIRFLRKRPAAEVAVTATVKEAAETAVDAADDRRRRRAAEARDSS
jgi:membrane protein DedA with SNARE-associated domain